MEIQPLKNTTIPKQLSSKTIIIQNNINLKQQIRVYFIQTYSLYEKLFELINSEQAYYIRAQPLRHPLIFYYAHTAAVYVNKFIDHGIIRERINPIYEKIFAVGVDQMDWDDLNFTHYDWPSLENAKSFRSQVKKMILDVLERSTQNHIQNWMNKLWVVLMGIQHERIHLQTSAVIIRRVPLDYLKQVQGFVECDKRQHQIQKVPKNKMISVPTWTNTWKRRKQNALTYGWDNQFGIKKFDVKTFKASQMLVSNAEYLQFVEQGGYQRSELWTEEGQRCITSTKPTLPLFWRYSEGKYLLRTLNKQIDMPWDWPVQISNLQARAFCNWKTQKTGEYTRLPTEDQYYAIRNQLKKDQTDWEYQSVGNINLEYWMSPSPVNMFKTGDFYDIVGNVWQHTITPIYPFQKFEIHPVYQDFTTPTFDHRHDLIKGGSFISTGNLALYHSRYAFRRHFYQFAGFRYVQSQIHLEVDLQSNQIISDKNVEMNLKHHYLNKKSYVLEVIQRIKEKFALNSKHNKVLTVGCSVGRIPIELGKIFGVSIGIDSTTRYFQMSTRLQQTGFLKFKDIDIDLKKLDIQNTNISLLQMNPSNPDENKINECDLIIIDGFSLKKDSLDQVLSKITKLANRNCTFVVLNVDGKNKVSRQKIRKILAKSSQCQIEIGGQQRLRASDEDQSYLPDWQQQLTFQMNYFKMIEGQLNDRSN